MSADPDLTALLGSRLCHDLIGPVGAIGNGVELLLLARNGSSDEVALLSESVTALTARLRFFRIAFGLARHDQIVQRSEVKSILADLHPSGRISVDWISPAELPRVEVKAAFLLLLCAESAIRGTGTIRVLRDEAGWSLTLGSARLLPDPRLWEVLESSAPVADLSPDEVQFAMAARLLADLGRRPDLEAGHETLRISF
jgi:histidine phosphotransferase ChpT